MRARPEWPGERDPNRHRPQMRRALVHPHCELPTAHRATDIRTNAPLPHMCITTSDISNTHSHSRKSNRRHPDPPPGSQPGPRTGRIRATGPYLHGPYGEVAGKWNS
ncbi:hypothetical protein GCM10010230_26370 [Streptomyces narbonensis]|nr:hypothetical protein GCM10010230_26370 [Streptomyces narbonensis]